MCNLQYIMVELIDACEYNNVDKVKEILNDEIIDVNFQDEYGNTALIRASTNGCIEAVKLLLNYEKELVDPNIQNNDGETALINASYNYHTEIVKLLLNYEKIVVNPNIQEYGEYGELSTALIDSSHFGYIEIVKLLLNYEKVSIDPYICNHDRLTALELANDNNHIEIVKMLEFYISFRKNVRVFIPPYNILLLILIRSEKYKLPNEMILLIKECGIIICGRELFI